MLNIDSSSGTLISEPDIISRGFVYVKENEELLLELRQIIKEEITVLETKEWSTVKGAIKSKLTKHIFRKTKRDPMILPIIVEV